MIKSAQVAYLLPILLVLVAACGPAQSATDGPTASRDTTVSANSSAAIEVGSTAPEVLAKTTFVHDGFRTEVSKTIEGKEVGSRASSPAGGRQAVTVSLRNLSQSTGGIQSRATINFASGLNNFVVLPTGEGPLTLYLHRDGTLGPSPDDGGFT